MTQHLTDIFSYRPEIKMEFSNFINLIFFYMLQHVYHAVQTSTGINQVEVTSSIPTELVKPNITQAQEKNHLLDMFSVITGRSYNFTNL